MTTRILILLSLFLGTLVCSGQTIIHSNKQDSICKYGKKYDTPEHGTMNFPSVKVTDDYKIKELHKAIPAPLSNDEDEKRWYYNYYFVAEISDYDPKGDSIFKPKADKLLYKLKDTYFFDINGDGLLDFIHYPKYYKSIMLDINAYEIFIQEKTGYKLLTFLGYITDIEFNKDGTLNKMKTYQTACCDNNWSTFYYYLFNKTTNELTETKKEKILDCQLKKK